MRILSLGAPYLAFTALHFVLLVLALTVAGLYGVDLQRADKANKPYDSKWVFAEVVSGLSAITALLYFVPFVLRFMVVWAWNLVLFVLWISLFGVFADMYLKEDPEGNSDIQRMKNAVWVNLVNALLWLVSAVAAYGYWRGHRERSSRFTGRAEV